RANGDLRNGVCVARVRLSLLEVTMLSRRMMALVLAMAFIPAALAARGDEAAEKSARSAADAWLALVDRGQYGESWDAAAAFFKGAISRSQWGETLKKVRGRLGKLNSPK